MTDEVIDPSLNSVGKGIGNDIYIEAKRWFTSLDPEEKKLSDYRSGLQASLGNIQIMGMTTPRRLEHTYVGLKICDQLRKFQKHEMSGEEVHRSRLMAQAKKFTNFRDQKEIDKLITELGYTRLADMKEEVTPSRRVSKELANENDVDNGTHQRLGKQSAYHGTDALKYIGDHQRLLVLGQPGCGKTTLQVSRSGLLWILQDATGNNASTADICTTSGDGAYRTTKARGQMAPSICLELR